MNSRKRDKYQDYAECSHRVYDKEVLSWNPYFEQTEDYCKLGSTEKKMKKNADATIASI